MSEEWTPPSWIYRGRRPPDDSAYFENLTHCVFQAGLNWSVVGDKWPNFREAFEGFDIPRVAGYGAEDVKRLMGNPGIIRNRRKILATIDNAREFERIASENGSFQDWLDGLDKSGNYVNVVKRLKARFSHVGDSTARIFLYTVGEPIKREDPHR